jgi:hypothetical protein
MTPTVRPVERLAATVATNAPGRAGARAEGRPTTPFSSVLAEKGVPTGRSVKELPPSHPAERHQVARKAGPRKFRRHLLPPGGATTLPVVSVVLPRQEKRASGVQTTGIPCGESGGGAGTAEPAALASSHAPRPPRDFVSATRAGEDAFTSGGLRGQAGEPPPPQSAFRGDMAGGSGSVVALRSAPPDAGEALCLSRRRADPSDRRRRHHGLGRWSRGAWPRGPPRHHGRTHEARMR